MLIDEQSHYLATVRRPDADESGPPGHRESTAGSPPSAQALASAAEPVRSGFYLRAGGAGGHADEPGARDAADSLPPIGGAVVVHVHIDPVSGRLAVGGRLLTAGEFNDEVVPLLGLAAGQLLVLMPRELGGQQPSALLAATALLAELGRRPVLVECGQPESDPLTVALRLYLPGRAEPVELGSYLDLEQEPSQELAEQPPGEEPAPLSALPGPGTGPESGRDVGRRPGAGGGPGMGWPPAAARLGGIMRAPWGTLAVEVAVPAFSDGSLGLPVLALGPTGAGGRRAGMGLPGAGVGGGGCGGSRGGGAAVCYPARPGGRRAG